MIKENSFHLFNSLVSSFRLSEPENLNEYENIKVSNHEWTEAETGKITQMPAVWYKPDGNLTPKALQEKLAKWISRRGIVVNNEIAGIMINLLALLSEDGHTLSETLDFMEQHVFEVDVQHCHLLPNLDGDGWNGALVWDEFEFGRLDCNKLINLCRVANAVTLEKSAASLDGAPGFWSPIFRRKIIDVGRLFWTLRSPAVAKYGENLLQSYLFQTASLHIDEMWDELEDAFLIPFGLSYPFIDLTALRVATAAESWTYYSGIGQNGAQSWIGKKISLSTLRMPKDLGPIQQRLDQTSQRYQIKQLNASSLYGLLVQVSRSIAKSNSHFWSSRRDESFLFLIIGLEQVFTEKLNTSKAITKRTALVTHRSLDLTFEEAEKLVKRLYDRRSRLVHDGVTGVIIDDLISARDLATETMRCLTRVCAQPESNNHGYQEKWLKKLDYLIAGIDAGSPPSDAALIEVGILKRKTP